MALDPCFKATVALWHKLLDYLLPLMSGLSAKCHRSAGENSCTDYTEKKCLLTTAIDVAQIMRF